MKDIIVLILAILCYATSATFHQKWTDANYISGNSISHGYTIRNRTPRNEKIELVFAVKQQNLKELETILYAVSDPSNKEAYGNI